MRFLLLVLQILLVPHQILLGKSEPGCAGDLALSNVYPQLHRQRKIDQQKKEMPETIKGAAQVFDKINMHIRRSLEKLPPYMVNRISQTLPDYC